MNDTPDNKPIPPAPRNPLAEMVERLNADLAAAGVKVMKEPFTGTKRMTATFIPRRKPDDKADK